MISIPGVPQGQAARGHPHRHQAALQAQAGARQLLQAAHLGHAAGAGQERPLPRLPPDVPGGSQDNGS